MKTLIITTGIYDWLVDKLLPSLYEAGNYNGCVLIVNYGEFEEVDKLEIRLKYENHVQFWDTVKVYKRYTTDRFRAFSEAISTMHYDKTYDIIMHVDGNDIEFKQDINPLLDRVKGRLLITQEPVKNRFVKYWETYWNIPFELRKVIRDELILNAGMFLGPAKLMSQVINDIAELEEYDSRFGMDQLMLNILCYYYKVPYTVVEHEWDVFPKYGIPDSEVKIMHYAGVIKGKPNETDFVVTKNYLFPVYPCDPDEVCSLPKVKPKGNYLFHDRNSDY